MSPLHEHAAVSAEDLKRNGRLPGSIEPGDADEMHPVVKTADGIVFLVAGGEAGGFSSLISRWGGGTSSQSITKAIKT